MRRGLQRARQRLREAGTTRLRLMWIAACGVALVAAYLLLARPSASESATDCVWTGTARTWIDRNANGRWDADEQPLADVALHIDDVANQYHDVGQPARSSSQGEAILRVWLPGCPRVAFEIYPAVPEGYRLTTAVRLPVNRAGPYDFGFVKQ